MGIYDLAFLYSCVLMQGGENVRVYWFSSLRNWIPISLIPVNGLSLMIWTMRKVRVLPSVRIGINAL